MVASEWTTIHFFKRINLGRSSEELRWPGFEETYEKMKHRFTIRRMRFHDALSLSDHMVRS